jgi:hypothetical protein
LTIARFAHQDDEMPNTRTAAYQLLDLKMNGRLEEYVTARRGEGLSWRLIMNEVRDQTGSDVSHETLRAWFPSLDRVAS